MTEPAQTLGQSIGAAIAQDGRTLDQIADAADIAASYLSRIRADKLVPSPDVLERLGQALPLDLDQARQLAAAAQAQRRLTKRRLRLRRDRDYLQRHAPQELDAPARSYAEPLPHLLEAAYEGLRKEDEQVRVTGRATPVLVQDTKQRTAWGIPMQIADLKLAPDGAVTLRLQTPQAMTLPEECALEVIFLPAVPYPECLHTLRIGPHERQQLGARYGLEITVPLPELGQGHLFPERDARSLVLRAAFAFRIVC